ncbi:hypothetical protein GCM10010406_21310 [Streptomyces thermolineatus]|uniref:DUF2637 domain-containing protein n=1 Tax=Streptomyces thermolineatus TaxID=44033 RepID=A0ABN3LL64_9ACTN
MLATPAGTQPPTTPDGDRQPQPNRPGIAPLTPLQKKLALGISLGVTAIAGIGFAGSYNAVTNLARAKGFGGFSEVFTLGVDLGIAVFLALDLFLAWLRMPYPLLRQIAWVLTGATVCYNAAAAYPDELGMAMHGTIPLLFIGAVEAVRHALGRIADITEDRHIENPPLIRWLVAPASTFRIWRRMRKWHITSYVEAVRHQKEVKVYKAGLRNDYGRMWRTKAPADKLLVLTLAGYGMSVSNAVDLPRKEAAARAEEAHRAQLAEQKAAEARRLEQEAATAEAARIRAAAEAEKQRIAAEARRIAEEADRQRRLAEAREQAELARLQEEQRLAKAKAEAEAQRIAEETEAARRLRAAELDAQQRTIEEQQRLAALKAQADAAAAQAEIDRLAAQTEADRRIELARAKAEEDRIAAEARAAETKRREEDRRRAEAARRLAPRAASASPEPASAPATPGASGSANANGASQSAPASASSTATSRPATSSPRATAPVASANAASGGGIDLEDVVATYQALMERNGKAPSDAVLGEALGVSRSRAQQLRTAAIEAGHTELAKPLRLAS